MDPAETQFRAAMAHADRLYAIAEEQPLLSSVGRSGAANEEPSPRPDLAISSLRPAAAAVIERYLNVSPASLAVELADCRYLTPDSPDQPPVVFMFTSCTGSTFLSYRAHQAGLTTLPALEIMNPEILPFFSLAMGATTVSHYLHLMSLFYQKREPGRPGLFAFKLSHADYMAIRSSGYWRYWASRAFYIRLRRLNLERQAASLYKASTTHQWASFQPSTSHFALDTKKLLETYDDLLNQERSWDEFYSECPGTRAITFFYEEFKSDPVFAVQELSYCLGQSSPAGAGLIRPDRAPTRIQSDAVDEVLEDLIRSLRGVTTVELVERLYKLVLERSADPEGLRYWTVIAQSEGFDAVLLRILNTDERRSLQGRKRDALAIARRPGKEPARALLDPYYGQRTVQDILVLEDNIEISRNTDFRIELTTSCQDCDAVPKTADAGYVVVGQKNETVQIMHNGIRVLAGGYYGPWMTEIIARLRGHHEPQEEMVFHQVLRLIQGEATMLELGGFWSYYSMWFLHGDRSQRRAFVVEPDPNHLAVGRRNAELNGLTIQFTQAAVGRESRETTPFPTETAGLQTMRQISVPDFVMEHKITSIDILHCDAQGVEFDVLRSCESLFREQRIRFAFVSTHDRFISGDPLTHQRCLAFLRLVGARILAEHDVHESYSGDGLIVAYSGKEEIAWPEVRLSFNRYSSSLSRNPLIDLALARRNLP
jgi:FkbM family methyltransferase